MIKTIKRSVLGNVFISIFLGLTIFMVLSSYWLFQDIRNDRFRDMAYTLSVIKRYYELSFNQWELTLLSTGQRILEIKGKDQKIKRLDYANTALKNYPSLLAFGFTDTNGEVLVFTGYSPNDSFPNLMLSENSKRSFIHALSAENISIGEAYYFPNVNDWILPIRLAIRDSANIVRAVNTTAVQYKSINKELKSFGFDTSYRFHMVNTLFNTSQIYYPLNVGEYNSRLRKDANIYTDIETIDNIEEFEIFTAENTFEKNEIFGIRAPLEGLNHSLFLTVDQVIIRFQFWSSFQIILLIYILLSIATGLLFTYFRKKEDEYLDQLETERSYTTNIVNSSPSFIIGMNEKLEFLFVNPAIEKITGYSKSELIGNKSLEKLCPEDYYIQVQKLEAELLKGDNVYTFELKMQHKNGQLLIANINVRNNVDSNDYYKYIVFGQDITERRLAQQKLRQREANLKALFESTNSIIGLFDRDKKLVEYNDSFAAYSFNIEGIELYSGIDLIAKMKTRVIAEVIETYLTQALDGEKVKETLEYPLNDSSMFFLLNCNPIYENNQIIGVSMFVEDITTLKTTQQKLEKYNQNLEEEVRLRTEELESKNEMLSSSYSELEKTLSDLKETQNQLVQAEKMASLGVLAAGIGHEINNPLNFIKNGALALSSELKKLDASSVEKVNPIVDIINDGVERASKIVKSLSHFSRKASELNEECDIHVIIENCLVILQNKIKHKAGLKTDFCKDQLVIRGSEAKLHQAFLNIIANAEQAIQSEGLIEITTRKSRGKINVSIKDNGIGIPKENLSKISDPFFTTKAPGVGTGLGLFITYNLIEEHNGRIQVKSREGKGTEFLITLPFE